MLQFEVLIFEARAINGLPTGPVMVGEVSSLTHTARSMKWGRENDWLVESKHSKVKHKT